MSAITYPQLALPNGATYYTKFSLIASRRIREWGADLDKLPTNEDEAWKQLRTQVAAMCCVVVDGKLAHDPAVTPEVIDAMYDGDPGFADMRYLRDAVNLAISFRTPSADAGSLSEAAPVQ